MTFFNALKVGIDNYANFSGRSSRSEFWWFYLGCVLLMIILPILTGVIGALFSKGYGGSLGALIGLGMAEILILLPLIAVSVRRLHDTGHSGWWYFIVFIPLVGQIWFLILMLKESDEKNEYGLPSY